MLTTRRQLPVPGGLGAQGCAGTGVACTRSPSRQWPGIFSGASRSQTNKRTRADVLSLREKRVVCGGPVRPWHRGAWFLPWSPWGSGWRVVSRGWHGAGQAVPGPAQRTRLSSCSLAPASGGHPGQQCPRPHFREQRAGGLRVPVTQQRAPGPAGARRQGNLSSEAGMTATPVACGFRRKRLATLPASVGRRVRCFSRRLQCPSCTGSQGLAKREPDSRVAAAEGHTQR